MLPVPRQQRLTMSAITKQEKKSEDYAYSTSNK